MLSGMFSPSKGKRAGWAFRARCTFEQAHHRPKQNHRISASRSGYIATLAASHSVGSAAFATDVPGMAAPAGLRSHNGSEQRPDACGDRHGQCAPERDAHRAHGHACSARARSQPAQKGEERQ